MINDNASIMHNQLFHFSLADEPIWRRWRVTAKPYKHQQKKMTAPDAAECGSALVGICIRALFQGLDVFQVLIADPYCRPLSYDRKFCWGQNLIRLAEIDHARSSLLDKRAFHRPSHLSHHPWLSRAETRQRPSIGTGTDPGWKNWSILFVSRAGEQCPCQCTPPATILQYFL